MLISSERKLLLSVITVNIFVALRKEWAAVRIYICIWYHFRCSFECCFKLQLRFESGWHDPFLAQGCFKDSKYRSVWCGPHPVDFSVQWHISDCLGAAGGKIGISVVEQRYCLECNLASCGNSIYRGYKLNLYDRGPRWPSSPGFSPCSWDQWQLLNIEERLILSLGLIIPGQLLGQRVYHSGWYDDAKMICIQGRPRFQFQVFVFSLATRMHSHSLSWCWVVAATNTPRESCNLNGKHPLIFKFMVC